MQHYDAMAKQSTGSDVGTGGMATKLSAARIATASGTDMIIANGKDVGIIHQIISGTISVEPYSVHRTMRHLIFMHICRKIR